MRILIVEDDNYKSTAINGWLGKEYPSAHVDIAASYRDGCLSALTGKYDLLILDMSLPARINKAGGSGDTIVNGGELIIRELLDEQVNFHAVILTQYETFNGETIEIIDQRLRQLCGDKFRGCISYNSQDDSWKTNLKIVIDHVESIDCCRHTTENS